MKRFLVAVGILWLLGSHPAAAVGFQWATAPDPDDAPLQIAIWYPSDNPTADAMLGAFDMNVAVNGTISGIRHPLIVFSHGTGGMALNSFDTAIALAEAGFVVVAVTHTGDNYRDQSSAFTVRNFVDRPRHISRVIDFMLGSWSGHGSIDAERIGIFGHSAGGTTTLIAIGGIADLGRVAAFCQQNPDDWGCQRARQRGTIRTGTQAAAPISSLDPRIKAAVLAAPAIPVVFQPRGLAAVRVPVQLWVGAEDDIVRNGSLIRTLLPSPPDYHLIPHGGHFAYLTPCNEILAKSAPEICADPKDFDRTSFLRGFHRSIIAFYRTRLNVSSAKRPEPPA
jgi:predicted dienelactone hydrolase